MILTILKLTRGLLFQTMSSKELPPDGKNTIRNIQKQYQSQLSKLSFKTEVEMEFLDTVKEYMSVKTDINEETSRIRIATQQGILQVNAEYRKINEKHFIKEIQKVFWPKCNSIDSCLWVDEPP